MECMVPNPGGAPLDALIGAVIDHVPGARREQLAALQAGSSAVAAALSRA